MMKSLYSGVAGLKTHNQRMDVIGNNISNVNTTAFKASTVTFKDIFYQNKSRASSGDYARGGTNANQVGYGASLSSISQLMVQSGLQYSDRETDCAIYGEGFFQVMDQAGNILYTRNGSFHIDNYGNLCDAAGNIVLGVSGDPTGVAASSQRINLYVPPIDNRAASVTKTLNVGNNSYSFTFEASTFGEDGNISLTIQHGDIPFATQNGSNIVVQIDMNQDFGYYDDNGTPAYSATQAAIQFQEAIQEALDAGGITLADGVLPLRFSFDAPPGDGEISALAAYNTLTFEGEFDYDADNDPATPNVTGTGGVDLTFTAQTAGDFANSYEIDIQVNENATDVNARWSDNVLIITIPSTIDAAITDDDIDDGNTTATSIQAAIIAAAGGNANKMIDIVDNSGNGVISTDDAHTFINTTLRIGLGNGRDNFIKNLAEVIGTVKLTDGRTAAEQTTEDLEELFIDDDGVIYGVHAVHGTFAMGRIDLALFENPEGLNQYGTSYWRESLSSGAANVVTANDYGSGSVVSGALEMSNTDLAQEISDMIITQRGYQANTRVITVADSMLEELVNLKR